MIRFHLRISHIEWEGKEKIKGHQDDSKKDEDLLSQEAQAKVIADAKAKQKKNFSRFGNSTRK